MVQPKNNNTFIEVERWDVQNERRIELPEGPFVHSNQSSKKGMEIHFTQVFIPGKCLVDDIGNGPCHLMDHSL